MYRLRLVKELLLRPVWRELEVVSTIITLITVSTILPSVQSLMENWGVNKSIPPVFLSPITWAIVTLIIVLVALNEGLYRMLERYIPETIDAKIGLRPRTHEGYASIEVTNNEHKPLRCYASLIDVIHLYTPTNHWSILNTINPNNSKLSWGGGWDDEIKVIQAGGDKATVNIAKAAGNDVIFTLQQGDKLHHCLEFTVSVAIGGYLDDHPIEPIPFQAHIKLRSLGLEFVEEQSNNIETLNSGQ